MRLRTRVRVCARVYGHGQQYVAWWDCQRQNQRYRDHSRVGSEPTGYLLVDGGAQLKFTVP